MYANYFILNYILKFVLKMLKEFLENFFCYVLKSINVKMI